MSLRISRFWVPILSGLLGLVLCAPLLVLVVRGGWLSLAVDPQAGIAQGLPVSRLWDYAWGSFAVAVGATILATLWGGLSAYLLERWALPYRRWLIMAAIVPLATPSYLAAYVWVDSLVDWGIPGGLVRSLPSAWLLLGLALSPYVFLAALTAFAQTPRSLVDSGRLLGCSRWSCFWRIEWKLAAPAILGAALLVAMEVLADFGTVEHLALDTWSTGIYRSWNAYHNPQQTTALALSLLVAVGGLAALLQRTRLARSAAPSGRSHHQERRRNVGIGAQTVAIGGIVFPSALLIVYPAVVLVWRWLTRETEDVLPGEPVALLWLDSVLLALAGALLVVITGCAVVTLLRLTTRGGARMLPRLNSHGGARVLPRLNSHGGARMLLRGGLLGYALPGSVLAVGLLHLMTPLGVGGSLTAVLLAYVCRYVTVVATPLESAWKRVPLQVLEQARILGASSAGAVVRVGLPFVFPTLMAGAILVSLDVLKELPATLLLRPFGVDTLALQIHALASDERLAEAAPAALALLLTCVVGLTLAVRWGAFGEWVFRSVELQGPEASGPRLGTPKETGKGDP